MAKVETGSAADLEQFTKVQLREALQNAGDKQPAKATKADLIVAVGQLKRGPRSSALTRLRRALVAANEKATPTTTPEKPKKPSKGATSGSGEKLWVRRAGSTRGVYAKAFAIDGDTLTLTLESGSETTIPVAEVEAAGPSSIADALGVGNDGVPAAVVAQDVAA